MTTPKTPTSRLIREVTEDYVVLVDGTCIGTDRETGNIKVILPDPQDHEGGCQCDFCVRLRLERSQSAQLHGVDL